MILFVYLLDKLKPNQYGTKGSNRKKDK
jgi:hypothetical protein